MFGPAGLKVVLDLCELDEAGISGEQSNLSATVHVKNLLLCLFAEDYKVFVLVKSVCFFTAHTAVLVGGGCGRLFNL